MTIRWTLYTLRTIGLLQWIDFLLIRYGPLHMILKLRAKPLQFQAAPNTPGPHGILPYNLQRPPHSGQEVGRKTPIILPTVITQALHVYAPICMILGFQTPSNQVSAVVRTQGHHPASPNPSSSQFPMSFTGSCLTSFKCPHSVPRQFARHWKRGRFFLLQSNVSYLIQIPRRARFCWACCITSA